MSAPRHRPRTWPGLQPVVQEEITGCGIACVAAVVGVTYSQAKTIAATLGIHAADETLWSQTSHVRRLLRRFGYRAGVGESPFRGWDTLPDLALLAIKWRRDRGRAYWHWVVFVRAGDAACVLDSKKALRSHIRTDFGRMKPKWFIGVTCRRIGMIGA